MQLQGSNVNKKGISYHLTNIKTPLYREDDPVNQVVAKHAIRLLSHKVALTWAVMALLGERHQLPPN